MYADKRMANRGCIRLHRQRLLAICSCALLAACGGQGMKQEDMQSDTEKSFNKHLRSAYEMIETQHYDRAIPELTTCVDQSRPDADKRHFLIAAQTLAEAQFKKGDLQAAEKTCLEVIGTAESEYKTQTIQAQRRDMGMAQGKAEELLAHVYTAQNKLPQAVQAYRRALKIEDTIIGPQFEREAMLKGCSALLKKLGQSDETEVLEQEKVDTEFSISEKLGFARRRATQGDADGAEKLLLETVSIAETKKEYKNKDALEALDLLAQQYRESSRVDDCTKIMDKIDTWLVESQRKHSYWAAKNIFNRGLLLAKQEKYSDAREKYKLAVNQLDSLPQQNDATSAMAAAILNQTANSYFDQKDYKSARDYYTQSLQRIRKCQRPNPQLCDKLIRQLKKVDELGKGDAMHHQ